jgi:hypothetical protein
VVIGRAADFAMRCVYALTAGPGPGSPD